MTQAQEDRARRRSRTDPAEQERAREAAVDIARLLHDRHFEDILVLDVRGLSELTDFILLASGTSDRQIKAVGQEVEKVAEESGFARFGREVDATTTWLVLDCVSFVAHLFEPATRSHYDLEMMWGDAPRVHWQRTEKPGA